VGNVCVAEEFRLGVEAGAGHAGGAEDAAPHVVVVALTGYLGDDRAEGEEPRVAVAPLGTGLEQQRLLGDHGQDGGPLIDGAREAAKLALQPAIGDVVAHARGVGEQLVDGDGVRYLRGEARQVHAQGVIEAELSLLGELRHGHARKRLGHGREGEDGSGAVRYRELLVR